MRGDGKAREVFVVVMPVADFVYVPVPSLRRFVRALDSAWRYRTSVKNCDHSMRTVRNIRRASNYVDQFNNGRAESDFLCNLADHRFRRRLAPLYPSAYQAPCCIVGPVNQQDSILVIKDRSVGTNLGRHVSEVGRKTCAYIFCRQRKRLAVSAFRYFEKAFVSLYVVRVFGVREASSRYGLECIEEF